MKASGRPAAAERLVERDRRFEAVETNLRELILRVEERALGIEHREEIVRAFAVAHLGETQRFSRALFDLRLQHLALRKPAACRQGFFDIGERVENRLAVGFNKLALARFGDRDLALEPSGIEDGLKDGRGERYARGRTAEHREQRTACDACRT